MHLIREIFDERACDLVRVQLGRLVCLRAELPTVGPWHLLLALLARAQLALLASEKTRLRGVAEAR